MWVTWFLLLVLPSSLKAHRIQHEPTYLMIWPRSASVGGTLRVCVTVLRSDQPVTVKAAIVRDGVEVVAEEQHCPLNIPKTIQLKVPSSMSSGGVWVRVRGEVAGGVAGGAAFEHEAPLALASDNVSLLVYTDRQTYRQMQTVRFRVFAIRSDLRPFEEPLDIILLDPRGITMRKWSAVPTQKGSVNLQYQLSKQPFFGNWTIRASAQGHIEEKRIYIEEYYTPLFEVRVELAPFISETEQFVSGRVTANFTSGAPVRGNLTVTGRIEPVHTAMFGQPPEITVYIPNFSGSASFRLPLVELRRLTSAVGGSKLSVTASVGERSLDQIQSGHAQALLRKAELRLTFLGSSPQIFKPPFPFKTYVAVSHSDGSELESWRLGEQPLELLGTVQLRNGTQLPLPPRHELMSPRQFGMWEMDVDLSSIFNAPMLDQIASMSLIAVYSDESGERARASLLLHAAYSSSGRRMQVSTSTRMATIGEYIIFHVRSDFFVDHFSYLVVSVQGSILFQGRDSMSAGIKTFAIPISREMAPRATLLIYHIARGGELIADSLNFPVHPPSPSNVSVEVHSKFSNNSIEVLVRGRAGTRISLAASSIPWKQLSEERESVNELSFSWTDPEGWRGQHVQYPSPSPAMDTPQVFQMAGLNVFTDALTPQRPVSSKCGKGLVCLEGSSCFLPDQRCDGINDCPDHSDEARCPPVNILDMEEFHRTRTNRVSSSFDSTWLWEDITIGSHGESILRLSAPRSPSHWTISALAVSDDQGISTLHKTLKFNWILPFSVSVDLPSRCRLGEQVSLRATLFNNLGQEIEALLELGSSPHYRFVSVDPPHDVHNFSSAEHHHLVSIEAGKTSVVMIPIQATSLGTFNVTILAKSPTVKQVVCKSITADPEGVVEVRHTSSLLDLTQGSSFIVKYLDTNLTEDEEGSATITITGGVSSLGDPGGLLGDLGEWAGESALFSFAATLLGAIQKKKEDSKQSTDRQTMEKLNLAYQSLLSYQRPDGAFSIFPWNSPPNMWLSALCVRMLWMASKVVAWQNSLHVDTSVLSRAVDWLLRQQSSDGAFRESFPFDKRMVESSWKTLDVAPTSHVLLTLAEIKDLPGGLESRVQIARGRAQRFLESVYAQSGMGVLQAALLAHALARVESPRAQAAFDRLDARMRNAGGLRYWSREAVAPPPIRILSNHVLLLPRPFQVHESEGVSATGHALSAHVMSDGIIQQEIVRWLSAQRGSFSGWASTRDSLVALESLLSYSNRHTGTTTDVTVTLESEPSLGFTRHLHLDGSSRIVTLQIPRAHGIISVRAQGSGMALIQQSTRRHVTHVPMTTPPSHAYHLEVNAHLGGKNGSRLYISTCTRWSLLSEGVSSGMTILSVSVPTGYVLQLQHLKGLVSSQTVPHLKEARFDEDKGKAEFYFDQVGESDTCVSFIAHRWVPVAKISKFLYAKVHDFYAPERYNETIFELDELSFLELCHVCGSYQCPDCPISSHTPSRTSHAYHFFLILLMLTLVYSQ